MKSLSQPVQAPAPGCTLLRFAGDILVFSLALEQPAKGSAFLRTNLGHIRTRHTEIIDYVLRKEPVMGKDWYDIPMKQVSSTWFEVCVPLTEVGHFEAKAYFLPEEDITPVWQEGQNTVINVEPATTAAGNIIYNAFVRQFGPNKSGGFFRMEEEKEIVSSLDSKGYTVIPPSGKFRDLIRELDFIIYELGCSIIQLLPINPTPTTYGRMGRYGSPYASLGFTAVDPALAYFDPKSTPMDQFTELVDAVHSRGAKILLDIAVNHTGWAANLHETHPEWLKRDNEGRIVNPGAWGVVWEDLTELDYTHKPLWAHIADVFLIWAGRGVDGFRMDAGYMIPVPALKYIVSAVRSEFPETIFLLEGLGGKISVTRDILNHANFNWAYSELFQNYDRGQIEYYLPEAIQISDGLGITVHFAETHDNNRLASVSKRFARLRVTLCALFSPNGAFGFANGVEWYATEKINVHESPSINWGAAENMVSHIRRLTDILKYHPAFFDKAELHLVETGEGNHVVMERFHRPSETPVWVLANLDCDHPGYVAFCPIHDIHLCEDGTMQDLISCRNVKLERKGTALGCSLGPGEVVCLAGIPLEMNLPLNGKDRADSASPRVSRLMLRAKALEILSVYHPTWDDALSMLTPKGINTPDDAATLLVQDPDAFFRCANPETDEPRFVTWRYPVDLRRRVMIPKNHFLVIESPHPFTGDIRAISKRNLYRETSFFCNGKYLAVYSPKNSHELPFSASLHLSVFEKEQNHRHKAELLFLGDVRDNHIQTCFSREEVLDGEVLFLAANGRGGMTRACADWGSLHSKYDALLAANLHPDYPEDRWIMLSRIRGWMNFQGYSQSLCKDTLSGFRYVPGKCWKGIWDFRIPAGQGQEIDLSLMITPVPDENAVVIRIARQKSMKKPFLLPDEKPVRIIFRPDIENRNFHEVTKAFLGPEKAFPGAVTPEEAGFRFVPDEGHGLFMEISRGSYVNEPEWQYMVYREWEAQRGMDPHSDLFSPGYFEARIKGGESVAMTAMVFDPQKPLPEKMISIPESGLLSHPEKNKKVIQDDAGMISLLKSALSQYVVKRGDFNTVIAGYPWFLDWGRDTLIVNRGLISCGMMDIAKSIILTFARFEDKGTLPNMIRGNDAGNRDTSDAPLWFIICCSDILSRKEEEGFLDKDCGGRTIKEVVLSIIRSYMEGTKNGICMDPGTGLVFSPSHFTWMDTNYPAATPRQGYPVEIQAFWHHALQFAFSLTKDKAWENLAEKVRDSLMSLYYLDNEGYLADCLNASPGTSPNDAEKDDALRPNQLFALTLGTIIQEKMTKNILGACEPLLVPGAIRSLADKPLKKPLALFHQQIPLFDPHHPYQGKYAGDEDTQRKPAYHNGTAWTWVFPSYAEAWWMIYGKDARQTARSWLSSALYLLNQGAAGHLPEILDGDHPHTKRGCDAQAWGISELLRVWMKLI